MGQTSKWLKDRLEKIIYAQREFWKDTDYPYYLVTILPTHAYRSMGGTCLTNAFSLFLGDLSSISKQEGEKRLSMLISHEHFHHWNGHKIRPALPQAQSFWFSEGLTEYYSIKLLANLELISLDDQLNYLNEALYEYYSSPQRNMSNELIAENFWNDFDAQRLPYLRGFFLAMRWDYQMQLNGDSLDCAMRSMLQNQAPYTREDIEAFMGTYLGDQIKSDVQQYILFGAMLPPIPEALGSCYTLEWVEDEGFHMSASKKAGEICGVRSRSEAFNAGLRKGQKFLQFHRNGNDVVVVILDEAKQEKEIRYTLQSSATFIPQWILKK